MSHFWFEIIRRSRKRFGWVFVGVRDGRPRVLARSGRDYRSRKKARRAIRRLQYAFPRAEIRNADRFSLPFTKFEIVPGVLPLRVQSTPSGYVPAAASDRGYTALTPARTQESETSAQEQPIESEESRTESEQEQKPVTAGRRRKAT